MQNKAAIQAFAILLTLACLYHLSFTFATNRVERSALELNGGDRVRQQAYLDSIAAKETAWSIGIASYTYAEAKAREISLGLDLKGGINVTLEVSIPDLLKNMARNTSDVAFTKAMEAALERQRSSQRNFVDLFIEAFESINPGARLSATNLFGHADQTLINGKMENPEVAAILRNEADMALERTFEVLTSRIDNFGLTQPNIQRLSTANRIRVELPGVQNETRVRQLLEAPAKLEFWETYENKDILPRMDRVNEVLRESLRREKRGQSISESSDDEQGEEVADATGDDSSEPSVDESDTLASAETPAFEETTGVDPDKDPLYAIFQPFFIMNEGQAFYGDGPLIGFVSPANLDLFLEYMERPDVKRVLPPQLRLAIGHRLTPDGVFEVYALQDNSRDGSPALGGDVVVNARFQNDPKGGGFEVSMEMNKEGASAWAKLTEANIGRSVAIVLDDRVYSAPVVQGKISGGTSSITGRFTFAEAKSLASILKSGKLPTRAQIVEMAVVGPTLGEKSIRAGIFSLSIAFVIILIYMAFYYGKAGITANLALIANLFFLIGSLAALGTTLTLAGITGMVLTIGMSVDANVLIYERIREELRAGKGLKLALADGYDKAYRAIIDSNITTLLIALILILFGAGPVKGFAVTLFVGILTSLFSAIFITRLVFEAQLAKRKEITFSSKVTEKWFTNVQVNWLGKRKLYYIVSGLVIAAGIISFSTKGFNLGVDLSGGRSYVINFDQQVSAQDVAGKLSTAFGGEKAVVKYYGSNSSVSIVTKYRLTDDTAEGDRSVETEIYDALAPLMATPIGADEFLDKTTSYGFSSSERVGPTMARDVAIKSLWAIALSLTIMFLYILLRFRAWQYGLGALAALLHDVIIVLAVFSIFDGILPFSLEIDQAIIAAVLTVIGYSINDTVIIFDRIREYVRDSRRGTMVDLVNDALNSTIGRTFNTSITVIFVLLIAFLFGGEGIRGLSFAILIGVIVGTYSSLCIAAPVVIDLQKKLTGKRKS
jgi:SecD/SecF fusion protein